MTLQPNYIYIIYTPAKTNRSFNRNISQYPSNIIISEKGKSSQKQTSRWFLYSFCRHHGLHEYVIVSVLLAGLHTSVNHCHLLFWSQTEKQSSNHCGVWWGLSLEDRPEWSAGNKYSPVVFVYTVHLPIKMQMSARLQSKLSKHMKKWEKKERNK